MNAEQTSPAPTVSSERLFGSLPDWVQTGYDKDAVIHYCVQQKLYRGPEMTDSEMYEMMARGLYYRSTEQRQQLIKHDELGHRLPGEPNGRGQ